MRKTGIQFSEGKTRYSTGRIITWWRDWNNFFCHTKWYMNISVCKKKNRVEGRQDEKKKKKNRGDNTSSKGLKRVTLKQEGR